MDFLKKEIERKRKEKEELDQKLKEKEGRPTKYRKKGDYEKIKEEAYIAELTKEKKSEKVETRPTTEIQDNQQEIIQGEVMRKTALFYEIIKI